MSTQSQSQSNAQDNKPKDFTPTRIYILTTCQVGRHMCYAGNHHTFPRWVADQALALRDANGEPCARLSEPGDPLTPRAREARPAHISREDWERERLSGKAGK